MRKIFHTILFFIVFVGCKKSDDSTATAAARIEIIDNSVESADVNAVDYWDEVELAWSDEFDGNSLDTDKWLFQTFNPTVPNGELQKYLIDDNVEVSGGTLKIFAEQIGTDGGVGDFTSARLNGNFAFKYGRLEVRAKMPADKGNGLWSKVWMLGNNIETVGYPQSGEIDLVEHVSHIPDRYYNTIHTSAANNATSGPVELLTVEEEFHNYGVLWTHEYLKFYVDDIDNITYTFSRPSSANNDNWPFTKSFYFGMNIVVGGEFGGVEGVDSSTFPNNMEIDYVRVYHAK